MEIIRDKIRSIPCNECGEYFSPPSKILFSIGSMPIVCTSFLLFSFKYVETPDKHPPVPTPAINTSTSPFV